MSDFHRIRTLLESNRIELSSLYKEMDRDEGRLDSRNEAMDELSRNFLIALLEDRTCLFSDRHIQLILYAVKVQIASYDPYGDSFSQDCTELINIRENLLLELKKRGVEELGHDPKK